jgi:hypothetical protein
VRTQDNWTEWHFGKPDPVTAEVAFRDGKVEEVRCPPGW